MFFVILIFIWRMLTLIIFSLCAIAALVSVCLPIPRSICQRFDRLCSNKYLIMPHNFIFYSLGFVLTRRKYRPYMLSNGLSDDNVRQSTSILSYHCGSISHRYFCLSIFFSRHPHQAQRATANLIGEIIGETPGNVSDVTINIPAAPGTQLQK
jgi:hypothetical protein